MGIVKGRRKQLQSFMGDQEAMDALHKLAAERGWSTSRLVREGLDLLFAKHGVRPAATSWDNAEDDATADGESSPLGEKDTRVA